MTMELVELDRLMADVGPLDEAIMSCVKTPDGAYAIRFADVDVLVEADAVRGRLVLSAEIGAPAPSRAAAIYETLLSYNLLWRETGGLRMALTGRKGTVVQLVDLTAAEIDARRIALVAANLAERTLVWQAYFRSEGGDGATPVAAPIGDFIRV